MRELLTSLFLACCLFPIAAGAAKISSDLVKPSAPHKFDNLHDEPLWPSEVKSVYPSRQAFQRLPAAVAANVMVAEAKPVARVNVVLVSSTAANEAGKIQAQPSTLNDDTSVAQAREWCSERYRSYDPTDNTYQPYGGGPRRTCVAPTETTTVAGGQSLDIGVENLQSANVRWCMQRYSSYRIEDNSYQPFTGERRPCPGPGSQSASNSVRDSILRF